jgi:HK97 gp10 family phage protein
MIVQDNTDEILKELQQKQLAFVTAAAELVKSAAQSNADGFTDSGNLKNSIQRESYVEDGVAIGEVGPTAFYAVYLEYGTGKYAEGGRGRKTPWVYKHPKTGKFIFTFGNPAQPFMQTGYDSASRNFDRLKELLKL